VGIVSHLPAFRFFFLGKGEERSDAWWAGGRQGVMGWAGPNYYPNGLVAELCEELAKLDQASCVDMKELPG
jgi:hypothetical protein